MRTADTKHSNRPVGLLFRVERPVHIFSEKGKVWLVNLGIDWGLTHLRVMFQSVSSR